jgi:hypothetical protein
LLAPMPTASTSQILGNNECFEPYTSNICRCCIALHCIAPEKCPRDVHTSTRFLLQHILNIVSLTHMFNFLHILQTCVAPSLASSSASTLGC